MNTRSSLNYFNISDLSRRVAFIFFSLVVFIIHTNDTLACSHHKLSFLGFSAQSIALESGQTTGLLGGYQYLVYRSHKEEFTPCLSGISIGIRTSLRYGQVKENSLAWAVTQQEFGHLLAIQSNVHLGKGTLSLSMGTGGQWIIEEQSRLQGQRLNQQMTAETNQITLNRSAQIWLPAVNLAPSIELQLIETSWSQISLLSRVVFAYHFLDANMPSAIDPWTWGIQLGVSMSLKASSLKTTKEGTKPPISSLIRGGE